MASTRPESPSAGVLSRFAASERLGTTNRSGTPLTAQLVLVQDFQREVPFTLHRLSNHSVE
jgi:hypothetical protein